MFTFFSYDLLFTPLPSPVPTFRLRHLKADVELDAAHFAARRSGRLSPELGLRIIFDTLRPASAELRSPG